MTTGLQTHDLTLGYGTRRVIHDLNLSLPHGKVTAILGPNGCGKSTLLHALARLSPPQSGRITLDGTDIHHLKTRAMARQLAILPQDPTPPEGITVADLVARGRAPWRGPLQPWSSADQSACTSALHAVGLQELQNRLLTTLSGGQRQRAWIALILAQSAPTLLLDEPTTWLDLPHQIEILRLLQHMNRTAGTTVISVLHDLNLAARFSDHLILLGPDGPIAQGTPHEVIREDTLAAAFGLAARVLPDPISGAPLIHPL